MKKHPANHGEGRRQSPKRLVRFALQVEGNVDNAELQKQIDVCLATAASPYLPDLLAVDNSFWDYHEKVGRRWSTLVDERAGELRPPYLADAETLARRQEAVRSGLPPGIPFRLDPLLPEGQKRPPKHAPELVRFNFLILTLPLYEADQRREQCNPTGALFDIAHLLKTHCKLSSVNPDIPYTGFEFFSGDKGDKGDKGGKQGKGGDDSPCSPTTDDVDWHRANINHSAVPEGITGRGIVIGHPDTGWTRHSELNFTEDAATGIRSSTNFVPGSDINIIDPNSASQGEELVPSPPGQIPLTRFRYHGTQTAGLMISNETQGVPTDKVRGLAPEATVVSIRCVDGVILLADINVAQAVVAAVEAGVHVISISLGGYPAPVLDWAIRWAVANDVIVVAAAGNYYPFVVYPAAYPSCIGVGGSTIDDEVWSGSARNWPLNWPCPIDISAPAECVWNPFWNDSGEERRNRNSGTSFATAIVAGAAALWLQRFNRNLLVRQLNGRVPLQELFRHHLLRTARRPSGWNTILDGPGILDLEGLMDRQTLPDPRTFGTITYILGELSDSFSVFGNSLAAMLGDAANSVAEFADEMVTIMMSNPVVAAGIQGIETAIQTGQEIAADAAAQGQQALDDAQETLEETAQNIADAAEEVVNNVTAAASNAASTVIKSGTNTVKKIVSLFGL